MHFWNAMKNDMKTVTVNYFCGLGDLFVCNFSCSLSQKKIMSPHILYPTLRLQQNVVAKDHTGDLFQSFLNMENVIKNDSEKETSRARKSKKQQVSQKNQ